MCDLLTALDLPPFRPAHFHALIHKPGYEAIASQLYSHDDPILETRTTTTSSPKTAWQDCFSSSVPKGHQRSAG
ncbi:hypothetical protein [Streptomyces sp. AK08-02]|uniref:hypothetical protein n=1 Tax=Streptomyces sp. AK08-02 TaxID=3028654 RepID=UPI0039F5208B